MRFERGKPDGGTASGTDGRPSFSNTVPRELVHRRAISEVFMTDIHRISEGRYLAAAQWPRLHPFFHAGGGAYDTALIAESLRQATILLAHAWKACLWDRFSLCLISPFSPSAAMPAIPALLPRSMCC
jgi:hypothetical protein